MTNRIKRIEISRLHKGALLALDLSDGISDDNDHSFGVVKHLVRNSANDYDVVFETMDDQEARTNTQNITEVFESRLIKNRQMAPVIDAMYEQQFESDSRNTYSGETLKRILGDMTDQIKLRPSGRYLFVGQLEDYIITELLKRHPRPRAYIPRHRAANIVHCCIGEQQGVSGQLIRYDDGGERYLIIEIDVKRLRKWLKRNQSCFYTSSERVQDQMDAFELRYALQREADEREAMDDAMDEQKLKEREEFEEAMAERDQAESDMFEEASANNQG